jgi:hypothetical protein
VLPLGIRVGGVYLTRDGTKDPDPEEFSSQLPPEGPSGLSRRACCDELPPTGLRWRGRALLERYMHAMCAMGLASFRAFAEKFDFPGYRTLCDLGGASGQLSIEVARSHPQMRRTPRNLPAGAPVAKRALATYAPGNRIAVRTCDMSWDRFPGMGVLTIKDGAPRPGLT